MIFLYLYISDIEQVEAEQPDHELMWNIHLLSQVNILIASCAFSFMFCLYRFWLEAVMRYFRIQMIWLFVLKDAFIWSQS